MLVCFFANEIDCSFVAVYYFVFVSYSLYELQNVRESGNIIYQHILVQCLHEIGTNLGSKKIPINVNILGIDPDEMVEGSHHFSQFFLLFLDQFLGPFH